MNVSIEKFGLDHWSTLLYVECRCVDHDGKPRLENMRCDRSRHPMFGDGRGACLPTRLAGGEELFEHDDWDCVDDLEKAGIVLNVGTGVNPRWKLTDLGWEIAGRLRRNRAEGKSDGEFSLKTFQEQAFAALANYYEAAIVVDFEVEGHAIGLFTEDLNGDGRERLAVGDGLNATLRAALTLIGKE